MYCLSQITSVETFQDKILGHLDELVAYITEAGKTGIEFAKDQLPLVAQEFIRLYIIQYGLEILAGIGIILFGLWLMKKILPKNDPECTPFPGDRGLRSVLSYGVLLVAVYWGGDMIGTATKKIIKPLFAPRIFLIETVRDVVKNK